MNNNFAKNLRKLRLRKLFSQRQLATALKTSISNVQNWEYGGNINLSNLMRVADYFEVDLDTLVCGDVSYH